MSISYEVLLAKMELELMKAKQAAKKGTKAGPYLCFEGSR